jgi:hypothetical protein
MKKKQNLDRLLTNSRNILAIVFIIWGAFYGLWKFAADHYINKHATQLNSVHIARNVKEIKVMHQELEKEVKATTDNLNKLTLDVKELKVKMSFVLSPQKIK